MQEKTYHIERTFIYNKVNIIGRVLKKIKFNHKYIFKLNYTVLSNIDILKCGLKNNYVEFYYDFM